MNLYNRFWDIAWKPISLLARLLLKSKRVQRSRLAPYVLGAVTGRWPERETDVENLDLSELSPEVRELILKRAADRHD